MSLPLAVHQRLDDLAELGADVNPTRAEIIAALVAAAPTDPDALEQLVMRYRKLKVGDLIPGPAEADAENKIVHLAPRAPGRPRRRRA